MATVMGNVRLLVALLIMTSDCQALPMCARSSETSWNTSGASLASFRLIPETPSRRHEAIAMTTRGMATTGTASILSTLRGGATKAAPPKETLLVGNIGRALRIFSNGYQTACGTVGTALRFADLAVIAFFAFCPQYILRFVHDQILNKSLWKNSPRNFDDGKTSLIGSLLCQIGQVALFIYGGEAFIIFLSALGVPGLEGKGRFFGSLVYAVWFAKKISLLKSFLLDRAVDRYPNSRKLSSRKLIYTRFLDFIIYLVGTLLFLDANDIDIGVAVASVLTLGGVSSVVVGLALKSPMEEVIQGTTLLLSDKFRPGDVIRLGDGTSGSVTDIRWTDTQIRGTDDSFVRVPHSQLSKTRVTNLSRTNRSQVKQDVTVPLKQTDKVDKIIQDIKNEIRVTCPKLILDGTLPFRVHWTEYNKDSLTITVDANFRIKRVSDEYWENRQNVLKAIARAVKNNEKSS